VRGVINLRGQVMPLVDLRARFGQSSRADEREQLVATLSEREEDHRRWVAELEASVRERRPFTLTTDPHACAFGRWYDRFKTDDVLLETILRRFAQPHDRIHALGKRVVDLMAKGEVEQCQALIDTARDTLLVQLVRLFDETRAALRDANRDVAVVLTSGGRHVAVAVDAIDAVERFERGAIEPDDPSNALQPDCIGPVARRGRDGHLVLTVRTAALLETTA
jgi:purine-binding chemotaxis protein CheW